MTIEAETTSLFKAEDWGAYTRTDGRYTPLWGIYCSGSSCDRYPHQPDLDDPAVAWCTNCGACIGTPHNTPGDTEALKVDEEPFGHPIELSEDAPRLAEGA